MAQVNYIKHLYEKEEKSLNEISKITGFNYCTVTKYAYMDNWSEDNLPNIEPQSYPVLGDFIPTIDEWLENDRKIPRKQRHTIRRIYSRLCDEKGYEGSYSSVKRYVRKKKYVMKQASEGYLPLAQPQGHAQVDFGEFIYYYENSNNKKFIESKFNISCNINSTHLVHNPYNMLSYLNDLFNVILLFFVIYTVQNSTINNILLEIFF